MIASEEIAAAQKLLSAAMVKTPTLELTSDRWRKVLPTIAGRAVKLELFQQVGSFKARGADLGVQSLTEEERARGVVTASGGNHALAVAWAAQKLGVRAKIAIPSATDPLRSDGCKAMGADVAFCDHIAHAFEVMERSVAEDGLTKIHPFEGRNMTLGAATCGAEFIAAHSDLDVIVVPVGGGGLIGGIAAAVKNVNPSVKVFGVEPFGADTLHRSLKHGQPVKSAKVNTCADSLASPTALPFSFSVAQAYVDEVVQVEDDELRKAMRLYQEVMGLMMEQACAASLAGALGPLKDKIAGRKLGLIACGSNISAQRYRSVLGEG